MEGEREDREGSFMLMVRVGLALTSCPAAVFPVCVIGEKGKEIRVNVLCFVVL